MVGEVVGGRAKITNILGFGVCTSVLGDMCGFMLRICVCMWIYVCACMDEVDGREI